MDNREVFHRNFNKYFSESKALQKDIADAVGVQRSTVSAWATGRAYPRADVVQKLAIFFGCQMSDLVIEAEAEEETDETHLLSMFRSLNATGRAKLLERAEELTVLYGGKTADVSNRKVHNA